MPKKFLIPTAVLLLLLGLLGVWTDGTQPRREMASSNIFDIPQLQKNLETHVQTLTQIKPSRSYQNIESLNKAADYIYNYFSTLGLTPQFQNYDVDEAGTKRTYKNISAIYGDPSKERIVIGAHYDVCDPKNENMSGADDNGSGVAGLLELARLIQEQKPHLKDYAIEFVAYSLEEPPYFRSENMGSYIHAKSLKDKNIGVKLMVSLEMIGYFSDEPGSQSYPFEQMSAIYGDKGNFIAVIGNTSSLGPVWKVQNLFSSAATLPIQKLAAPTDIKGIDYSDHRNYWKFNYPAVMLTDTSFMRNRNYHEPTDTPDTLNYEKMAQVVLGMKNVVLNY